MEGRQLSVHNDPFRWTVDNRIQHDINKYG